MPSRASSALLFPFSSCWGVQVCFARDVVLCCGVDGADALLCLCVCVCRSLSRLVQTTVCAVLRFTTDNF
jgi:hypothetical protein